MSATISKRISQARLRAQVRCTEERAGTLSAAAAAAEEVASEAMTAAGAAVHDEMEAATVVRETQARTAHVGFKG